jgi:hypothetical protein
MTFRRASVRRRRTCARLDLSLIHEPRRRAKLTAVSTSTYTGKSTEQ